MQASRILNRSDIGDALIETARMERAAIPDDTHIVLHGDGHAGSAVILENRDVEPAVAVENSAVNLRLLEDLGLREADFAIVFFFVAGQNGRAELFGGVFNTARLIALTPRVARIVEDDDFFRAGVFDRLNQGDDEIGIRIAGEFRRLVPADIRLNGNAVALLDETFDTAERGHPLFKHLRGLSAEERDHVDGFAVFLFGLLREDGDRLESAKRSGETGQRDGLQKVFTVHFHDKTFIFKS